MAAGGFSVLRVVGPVIFAAGVAVALAAADVVATKTYIRETNGGRENGYMFFFQTITYSLRIKY